MHNTCTKEHITAVQIRHDDFNGGYEYIREDELPFREEQMDDKKRNGHDDAYHCSNNVCNAEKEVTSTNP